MKDKVTALEKALPNSNREQKLAVIEAKNKAIEQEKIKCFIQKKRAVRKSKTLQNDLAEADREHKLAVEKATAVIKKEKTKCLIQKKRAVRKVKTLEKDLANAKLAVKKAKA